MNNISNLFVTGIAGYIGSNTVNRLFCEYPNITFIGVDLKPEPTYINKHIIKSNRFKYYQVDIGNDKKIMKILKKHHITHVLDLASFMAWDNIPQTEFLENNIISRNKFFNTCIKYGSIQHLIYQSSVYATTNTLDNYNSSKNVYPKNQYNHLLYGTTKSADLSLIYSAITLNQIRATIVFPANAYGGSNQHKGDILLTQINELCKTGKIILGKDSNTNNDNWIDVSNIIDAYCIIFNQGFNGKNYNLVNQQQYYTLEQVAQLIVKYVTGTTDYCNYLVYDNSILTPIPNIKSYGIKSNFPPNVFNTTNTFEVELEKMAKCKCNK